MSRVYLINKSNICHVETCPKVKPANANAAKKYSKIRKNAENAPLFNSADTVGRECSIRLPNKTKGFYRERKKDSYKTRRQGLSLLGSNEITPNVFVRATILNEYV